jgi:hypothetical protein
MTSLKNVNKLAVWAKVTNLTLQESMIITYYEKLKKIKI